MSGEGPALRAYRADQSGWYVVNPKTDLAVAGPFPDQDSAEVERFNRELPKNGPPAGLVVREVVMNQRWINAGSTVWHAERSCAERPTAGFPEGRKAFRVSEDPEPSYFDGRPCGRCVPAERRAEAYDPEEVGMEPITPSNAQDKGEFGRYRKTALSTISEFTVPPGTPFETPEGLKAEDEEARIAFDSQGGVYPIRESVFQETYERAEGSDQDKELIR